MYLSTRHGYERYLRTDFSEQPYQQYFIVFKKFIQVNVIKVLHRLRIIPTISLLLLLSVYSATAQSEGDTTVIIIENSCDTLLKKLEAKNELIDSLQKDIDKYQSGDSLIVGINGFGNLQPNLLNNARGPDGNIALGVSFNRRWKDSWSILNVKSLYFKVNLNIASSADTLSLFTDTPTASSFNSTRALGQYLLYPITSAQTADLDFLYYLETNFYGLVSGFNFKIMASNRSFKFSDQEFINALGIYYRVGFFHDFIPEAARFEEGISLRAGISFTRRFLRGDIELDEFADQFEKIIPDGKDNFSGLELNFAINVKDISIELNLPFKTDSEIPGLGGAQFSDLIAFGGGLKLPLNTKTKRN